MQNEIYIFNLLYNFNMCVPGDTRIASAAQWDICPYIRKQTSFCQLPQRFAPSVRAYKLVITLSIHQGLLQKMIFVKMHTIFCYQSHMVYRNIPNGTQQGLQGPY